MASALPGRSFDQDSPGTSSASSQKWTAPVDDRATDRSHRRTRLLPGLLRGARFRRSRKPGHTPSSAGSRGPARSARRRTSRARRHPRSTPETGQPRPTEPAGSLPGLRLGILRVTEYPLRTPGLLPCRTGASSSWGPSPPTGALSATMLRRTGWFTTASDSEIVKPPPRAGGVAGHPRWRGGYEGCPRCRVIDRPKFGSVPIRSR